MTVKLEEKEAISKAGNTYTYLSLEIAPGIEKRIMLTRAEMMLFKARYKG